jgi:ribosomal protein L17
MSIVVAPEDVDEALAILKEQGEDPYIIGSIIEGENKIILEQTLKEDVVNKLFTEIAPNYEERNGGYTRIVKIGPRRGDGAEMAIVQLV